MIFSAHCAAISCTNYHGQPHILALMQPLAVIYSVTMVTPCPPRKAGFELLPVNWHRKVTTEKCVPCWISHLPLSRTRHPRGQDMATRTQCFDEHPMKSLSTSTKKYGWWLIGAQMYLDIPSPWKIWIIQYSPLRIHGGEENAPYTLKLCLLSWPTYQPTLLLFICLVFVWVFFLFELQPAFKIVTLHLFTVRSLMILCNRLLPSFSSIQYLHVVSHLRLSLQQSLQEFGCKDFKVEKNWNHGLFDLCSSWVALNITFIVLFMELFMSYLW